jgi:hypothetical protein
MTRLTHAQREAAPSASGEKGHYPIPDIEHGRKAVQMASHAGPEEAAKIRSAVHRRYPSIKIGGAKKKRAGFGSLAPRRDDDGDHEYR